ncbi:MAG TPA: MFS transporter [Firmicutes bacterium]|nr:MFS transporter [Bacillota bacterium]
MEFTAYIAFVFLGASATVNGVALPFLIEHFSLPLSTAGSLFLISSLGYLLSSTFYPSIARVTGNRFLIAAGSLAAALTLLVLPLMPVWVGVVAAAFFSGVGYSIIDVGLNAAVSGIPGERGTAALNWLHFSFGLGALASPFFLALIINWFGGWQWAYWACAVPFVPLTLALLRTPLLRLEQAEARPASREKPASTSIYRERVFWLLMGLMAVYCGVEGSLMGWIPTYLTAEFSLQAKTASLGVSLMWLGLAIGRGVAGRFSHRFTPRATVLILFPATAAILLAIAALKSPWLVLAGFLLAGLSLSAIFPMVMLNGTQAYPYARVQVSGGLVTAAGIGGLVFPWVLGYVGEYANLRWGILLLAVISLAAGMAVTRLPREEQDVIITNPAELPH